MSLPIEFKTEIIYEKEIITIFQLKDGSVYMIQNKKPSESPETPDLNVEPLSRSFYGMLLKDEMRKLMTAYIRNREKFKEARKIGNDVGMHLFQEYSKEDMKRYRHLQKGWNKFKEHSSKHKKKSVMTTSNTTSFYPNGLQWTYTGNDGNYYLVTSDTNPSFYTFSINKNTAGTRNNVKKRAKKDKFAL